MRSPFSFMTTDLFWQIIGSVHRESGGDMGRKCELLKDRLSILTPEDLTDFISHFDAADAAAYTWPLWGAAYVMHGGCSDDSFSDFRATLISQGHTTYERALADPDSLAELTFNDKEDICYEGFQYVTYRVAERRQITIPEMTTTFPDEPTGEDWDEDSLDQLYPKLAAKYSSHGATGSLSSSKKPWWKFW